MLEVNLAAPRYEAMVFDNSYKGLPAEGFLCAVVWAPGRHLKPVKISVRLRQGPHQEDRVRKVGDWVTL